MWVRVGVCVWVRARVCVCGGEGNDVRDEFKSPVGVKILFFESGGNESIRRETHVDRIPGVTSLSSSSVRQHVNHSESVRQTVRQTAS